MHQVGQGAVCQRPATTHIKHHLIVSQHFPQLPTSDTKLLILLNKLKKHRKQWQNKNTNLHQRQNFNQKSSGIPIRIVRLIQIWMSIRSIPECCGCIILSASVISPSMVQMAVDCMRNANRCPKIPYSAMVKKIKKVIQHPHVDADHHQKLITSTGSPIAHACQSWSTSVSAFVSYPV